MSNPSCTPSVPFRNGVASLSIICRCTNSSTARRRMFPNRHRLILHNSFGIAVAEQVFGLAITNANGRRVFVREIGQQHVLEDLGMIPTLADCLSEVRIRPWMRAPINSSATPWPTVPKDNCSIRLSQLRRGGGVIRAAAGKRLEKIRITASSRRRFHCPQSREGARG